MDQCLIPYGGMLLILIFTFFMFLFSHFSIITMYYLYNNKFFKPLKKMKLVGRLRHLTNYVFNRKCTTAETKNYLKEM